MTPKTLQEWSSYIDTLSGRDLYEAARGAGSVKFMLKLRAEGSEPNDVTEIQKMFAIRFVELGIEPPGRANGCVIDFRRLSGV